MLTIVLCGLLFASIISAYVLSILHLADPKKNSRLNRGAYDLLSLAVSIAGFIIYVTTGNLWLLAFSCIAAIGLLLHSTRVIQTILMKRAMNRAGLPEQVRYLTQKSLPSLGLAKAFYVSVAGTHQDTPPILRGTHLTWRFEDYLDAAPELRWPMNQYDALCRFISVARQTRNTDGAYFGQSLEELFEEVYEELLPFSGRITDENVERVTELAEAYGIEAARHGLDGDMPNEYLAALGLEPREDERMRFYWELDK